MLPGIVERAGFGSIGRGLLVLSVCLAGAALPQTVHAQEATLSPGATSDPAKLEEAKRHFQRGLTLLRDPEGEVVEGAYLEFKTAYELSHSPRVLGNIGYCAMRMERNAESVAAYREYLRLAPGISPTERAQVEQDLLTMTDGAATVSIRYTGSTVWTLIDERMPVRASTVTNTYTTPAGQPLTLLLHAGHHVLHVKADAEEQARWEFDALGGTSVTHTFEPKRVPLQPITAGTRAEPEGPPPSRAPEAVLMAVGGAAIVGGVVTGFVALGKMNDLQHECPGNICPDGSYRNEVSTASALGTVTDTLLFGGGALFAGGTLWLLLSPSRHARDSAKQDRHTEPRLPAVSGTCLPGACTLSIRGSF
jgi:hypothetical protein